MRITKKFQLSLIVSALFAAGPVMGNQLVLVDDAGQSKGARVFSLDFSSDGRGTALEARLDVGVSGKDAVVDVSNCAKNLPKSHTGSCVFNGEQVVVLIYSATNALLPSGLLDLGTVAVSGASHGAKPVAVAEFIVAAPDATALQSSVVADGTQDK